MAKAPKTLVAAEGRTVLTEDGALWPAEGMDDPETLFTRRRLADGDLVIKPAAKSSEEGKGK